MDEFDFDTLIKAAGALQDQMMLNEAIEYYDAAIKMKPDYHIAINDKGTALLDQGKYREGISCFEEALKIKTDYAISYNNIGYALNCLGKCEDALHYLDIALSIDSDSPFAYKNKGISYYKQGLYKESIQEFEKSLKIRPGLIETLRYKQLAENALAVPNTETVNPSTKNESNTTLCDICCDNQKNVAFVPCGHVSCCQACSEIINNNQKKCPICNSSVSSVLKLFMT